MSAPSGQPPPQIVVPGAGWVDVASRAIVQVGFPVVVAAVLLWFLLTRFQDTMKTITERMSANTNAAAQLVDAQQNEIAELHAQTEELKAQTTELKAQTVLVQRLIDLRLRELGVKP
jgi:hypothetical protein